MKKPLIAMAVAGASMPIYNSRHYDINDYQSALNRLSDV